MIPREEILVKYPEKTYPNGPSTAQTLPAKLFCVKFSKKFFELQPFASNGFPDRATRPRPSRTREAIQNQSKGVLTSFLIRRFLQPLVHRSFLMVLFLIPDVCDHPFQILTAKRHDPIAALPFKQLPLDLVIDVVRTRSLEFADPIGN